MILSGIPGNFLPKVTNFLDWVSPDKFAHFILYGTFSFLLMIGVRNQFPDNWYRMKYILITLIIGTVFGGLMEVMQQYVFIGRNGNLFDFVANVLGSVIGIAGFWFIRLKILNKY